MSYAERRKGKLSGYWYGEALHTRDGMETRFRKRFATKGEADGFEAYIRATGAPPPTAQAAPTESFAAVVERFKVKHADWLVAHDGKTNAGRLAAAVEFFGPMDIKAIRTRQLEDYVTHLTKHIGIVGRRPANATINRYLDAVSKVLQYAHRLDMLPAGMPVVPRTDNKGRKRAALTRAQEAAIVQAMELAGDKNEAFLVRLLAATGMRAGELHGLRADQIETPEQRENSGVKLTEEQTKTHAARWVPIVPEAARELRVLIASGAMPTPSRLYDTFKRAVEVCGDRSDFTIHSLRHTTVTRLLEAGADGLDVAAIVGHTVSLMTGRYYHPDKAHLFSVAEKVQHFGGDRPQVGDVVPFSKTA